MLALALSVFVALLASCGDEQAPSSDARVEWMFLLRDESAPSRFAYAMTLPSGLPSTNGEASGQVAFLDATGRALVVSLDARGLRFPVLLDPAVETGVWEDRTGAAAAAASRADRASVAVATRA